MTTTDTATEPAPPTTETPTDTWADQLEQLRARYKHVREPILVALNILLHDPGISLDDAKAQAATRGVRITAASVAAAQRLLSRRDDADDGADEPRAKGAAEAPRSPATRRTRRPRPAKEVDPEALIRGLVGKIQQQGNAAADRLREVMRRAIAMLQAAVEG
jgi:hypothetical protein